MPTYAAAAGHAFPVAPRVARRRKQLSSPRRPSTVGVERGLAPTRSAAAPIDVVQPEPAASTPPGGHAPGGVSKHLPQPGPVALRLSSLNHPRSRAYYDRQRALDKRQTKPSPPSPANVATSVRHGRGRLTLRVCHRRAFLDWTRSSGVRFAGPTLGGSGSRLATSVLRPAAYRSRSADRSERA